MELNTCDQLTVRESLKTHSYSVSGQYPRKSTHSAAALMFGAMALTLRPLAHPRAPLLGWAPPFTLLPTRRGPGNGRRWSLSFVGKELPVVAFIRITATVSLPFHCCRPHTRLVFLYWDRRPVWSCRLTYNKSASLIKGITSIF